MGCGGSKTKDKKEGSETANNAKADKGSQSSDLPDPEAAAGRATNGNDANMTNTDVAAKSDAASSAAPKTRKGDEVDDDGNPVVLPKGDWVRTENTPYFYSATENLYYHPPSCQFYDPTNEMWYDPEKDEWYRDETDGEDQGSEAA